MFENSYTKDQGKTILKVKYTHYLLDSENSIREITIENADIEKVKMKYVSTLVSFIGATFESYVVRFGTANRYQSKDVQNDYRTLKTLYERFINISSPGQQSIFIIKYMDYLKSIVRHADNDVKALLNEHLADLNSTTNRLISIVKPKQKSHAKNKMQNG